MATKQQVLELHRLYPHWSSIQIAEELGCKSAYVRATFQRNRLTLPNATIRKAAVARLLALGQECDDAGFTISDIRRFARQKRNAA